MWALLIALPFIIVVGIVFYVLLRKNQHNDPPIIIQKYGVLIQLLKGKGSVSAEKTGSRSLSFRKSQAQDAMTYFLNEVDDRVLVAWKLESKMHGRRGKEWSFNSSYDQTKMFEEINTDVKRYQQELFREN